MPQTAFIEIETPTGPVKVIQGNPLQPPPEVPLYLKIGKTWTLNTTRYTDKDYTRPDTSLATVIAATFSVTNVDGDAIATATLGTGLITVDSATGSVDVRLTEATTSNYTAGKYKYDFELDKGGIVDLHMHGAFIIEE